MNGLARPTASSADSHPIRTPGDDSPDTDQA
jgi:hypothetical protein